MLCKAPFYICSYKMLRLQCCGLIQWEYSLEWPCMDLVNGTTLIHQECMLICKLAQILINLRYGGQNHLSFCLLLNPSSNPEVVISVFPPLEGLQRILGTRKIFGFVRPLQSQQLSVSHHHLLHLYSCMMDAIEDKVLSRSSSRLEFGAWSLCGKRNQGWWGWWKRVDEIWQFHT